MAGRAPAVLARRRGDVILPPSDPWNPHAVARWCAEVALDDPERLQLWVQAAGGGVAWLRTTGEMPLGSSASGCRRAALVDYGRAEEIMRSQHAYQRWAALDRLAGEVRDALVVAVGPPK